MQGEVLRPGYGRAITQKWTRDEDKMTDLFTLR